MKISRPLVACSAALAIATTSLAGCTTPGATARQAGPAEQVAATADGFQRGPAPTAASISAARGPFPITQVAANGDGFNNGTIYYPTDTSQGTFGAIVVVPGFISNKSSIEWYGPRIASQGFVVMTINTNTPLDFPAARGNQQNAALRWLATQSPVANRIDPNRLGAMGWSMGGGGSLEAAADNPNIKAVIPLAGWNTKTNWSGLHTPALIVGCQGDVVAPVASMSQVYYNTIPGEKAILISSASGGHFCVTNANATIAKYSIAWLKRFIDDDTRYSPFICTTGTPSGATKYQNTCPM